MELPTLPAERGHSLGTRQRVERSFPAIRAPIGFLDVLEEALDRKFGERLRWLVNRDETAGEGGRERYISVPDFVRNIEKARDAMVRARAGARPVAPERSELRPVAHRTSSCHVARINSTNLFASEFPA